MNGADVIAEIMKREGTDFLSCYPRNPLIESCAKIGIRPILCRQERMGVAMADGYSRIRRGRQNGVFAAQHGPGIENAFSGVAQAYAENVPVLVVPAGFPAHRQYVRPTFRSAEVFRPVTKWSAMAHSPQELPDLMRRAYQAMRSGKPGPVLLEVPTDVFEAEFHGEIDYQTVPMCRVGPDPEAVEAAARMLLAARHPLIWAGQGIHYAQAAEKLAALAEMIPAPVAATNPGKSAIAETHPLALGASTRSCPKMYSVFLERCDVVLAIGSSLTKTSFGPAMPRGKTIIHSTNDPSDVNKDHRAAQGLVGDASLVLDALIAEVARQKKHSTAQALTELKAEIAAIKAEWLAEWAGQLDSNEEPLNQYRVIRDLMATVDRDNVIMTHDAGSPREQLLPFWETTRAGSYMGWGKTTQLGYGLGLAMGAKLAKPDKLCINVWGDAAIGFTGMDFETAVRERIPIMSILLNNFSMAIELKVMALSTEKYRTTDISGDYAAMARAFGGYGERVTRPEDIIPAIKRGIEQTRNGVPVLLEFITSKETQVSKFA